MPGDTSGRWWARRGESVSAEASPDGAESPHALDFDAVYREHAAFVWRVGRAMGVSNLHIDDVVHDVFLVVVRRLGDYDPGHSMRAWLAGITRRVVGHLRRKQGREQRRLQALPEPEPPRGPEQTLALREGERLMERFLGSLDEDKRTAFVLMELEGLTAREVAQACGSNQRTIYSRVRVARARFEAFAAEVDR